MSGRIVGEVLKFAPEDLTQLELLVLVALAEVANDKTRLATYETSAGQIAHRVRSTPSSVKSTLFRLRHRGLIVGLHDKPRKGLAQEYRLPNLHEGTRRAVLNGVTPINPPTTQSVDPDQPINGTKGSSPTTQAPVDNSPKVPPKG